MMCPSHADVSLPLYSLKVIFKKKDSHVTTKGNTGITQLQARTARNHQKLEVGRGTDSPSEPLRRNQFA